MPYRNEHTAVVSTKEYDSYRRQNNRMASGVHTLWGISQDKPEMASLRFDASKFTVAEAKKWLMEHNIKAVKFEAASEMKKAGKWDAWQGQGYAKPKKPKKKPKKVSKTNFPKKGSNLKISLSNSMYRQFDYRYALDLKVNYPELWKRAGNGGNPPTAFTGDDAFRMWSRYRNGQKNAAVLEWVKRRERIGSRNYYNIGLNGVISHMKWGVVNSAGASQMKTVVNKAKKQIMQRRKTKKNLEKGQSDAPNYRSNLGGTENCDSGCQYWKSPDWCGRYKFQCNSDWVCDSWEDTEEMEKTDHTSYMGLIKNINQEKRIVSGPVLVPDEKDLQEDIVETEEIEKAAHDFMKNFQQINIMHSNNYDDFAKGIIPIESVVLKNDLDFYGDGEIHKRGTWILDVFVGNDKVWDLVKEGKIKGYSIEGEAKRELA